MRLNRRTSATSAEECAGCFTFPAEGLHLHSSQIVGSSVELPLGRGSLHSSSMATAATTPAPVVVKRVLACGVAFSEDTNFHSKRLFMA